MPAIWSLTCRPVNAYISRYDETFSRVLTLK